MRTNRSKPLLVARVASAVLSELLEGPKARSELMAGMDASKGTIDRAIATLRRGGVVIDNVGTGGSVYVLRRPEVVRGRLARSMRLSFGDLIAAGGVSPALGVGMLIEAGALA